MAFMNGVRENRRKEREMNCQVVRFRTDSKIRPQLQRSESRSERRSKGAVREIPTLLGGDYEWSGLCSDVARQKGFEPPAFPLGGGRSIQLSYWRVSLFFAPWRGREATWSLYLKPHLLSMWTGPFLGITGTVPGGRRPPGRRHCPIGPPSA